MERRTKKMLLAILMIMSVLATDFFVLGSGIMTYASQFNSETNNPNVEFSVYFKENDNRIDSIEKSIKVEDVKLYAKIKVKNEGYLKEGTVIELENSNFDLKKDILSSNKHINSIEGNKVVLKQIGVGETVEIEMGIKPKTTDKITSDYLSEISTVKMIGSYVYSKAEEGQTIRTDKVVSINYVPDESIEAELETDVITNKIMISNGESKRIVQLLIKSRITNNEYPVKGTKLTATIPQLSEEKPEINAIAINELATNGKTEIDNIITENGLVEINLNNETSWMKNVYDEIVITYIYPETVDTKKVEITTNSEITLFDSKETVLKAESKEISENEELNNSISGRIENTTKELYKGKLYANLDLTYNTETEIAITNANIVEGIVVREGDDVFGISEKELAANTKYVTTEINLGEMLEILGQDGSLEIKNGETSYLINKETQIDENGNVRINYKNVTSKLEIKTSNPEKAGIIELKHTKSIIGKDYTRKQLQEVQSLKTKLSIEGISKSTEIGILKLKETTSKAELTIENNKTEFSTTEENNVTLGITLITNGEQYDLYKNPKISLKFPLAVNNVELISTPSKQNAEEFTIDVGSFDATNKTMLIKLNGEQNTYSKSELTQSYIQLNLKVTLDSLALGQHDKIIMAYTNENAIHYENEINCVGVTEQAVQISAPSQLIKMFNLSSNENTSYTDTILESIDEKEAGKTVDLGISLINNKDSDLSNLKILGKLPTTENTIKGQGTNTLKMNLKNITTENAEIYYTENSSATEDTQNTQNAWTKDLSTLSNAKLYLIKVDSLDRGAKFSATATMQIPNTIIENALSYTQYGVIYDTATETNVKESSRKIGLASAEVASIDTKITAHVGQDVLSEGDVVKQGEVIRYTVTVTNKGISTLENVQLKLDVPEGTTYVRPIEKYTFGEDTIENGAYVYIDGAYYEEVTDNKILETITNITISELSTSNAYIFEYEVRVNKDVEKKQISNVSTTIYDGTEVGSTEFNNTIQEANIRVTIKRAIDESIQLYPGGTAYYKAYIENLSNEVISNLNMQIISNQFNATKVERDEIPSKSKVVPEIINIDEIKANEKAYFYIEGLIANNVTEMVTSIVVSDSDGKRYRSNSLKEKIPHVDATINISSLQNGEYIKEGDIVEYNVTVKNTGHLNARVGIRGSIPNILQIQSIEVNGITKKQSTNENDTTTYSPIINNNIYEYLNLNVNQVALFKITAKVGYVPDIYHGSVISTCLDVTSIDIIKNTSNMVTHILKSKEMTDNENIISGIAWFDENKNGQMDGKEEKISNMFIKLYDISTQSYLKDVDGNLIQTITDDNGRYSLPKIVNGSYMVIFDYDMEKYEPTKVMAEGVETSINSKASIKYINIDGQRTRAAIFELNGLKGNELEINIGLKNNTGDWPIIPEDPEQPENPNIPENPESPEQPENPNIPENPESPEQPEDSKTPEIPENPDTPELPEKTEQPENPEKNLRTISGFVWLDSDIDGIKDAGENYLGGIKVMLYDILNKHFLTDEYGKIMEIETDNNGKYMFSNIEKGSYIIIFEFNTQQYKLSTQNLNIILKKININGQEKLVAVTNTKNVENNITNINVGLKECLKFDLELNKYISKIIVQTSKQTKAYDYNEKVLGKIEIHRKQIQGALVVLEYTIKVKNTGEIAGIAPNIVDYLPNGLTFSSELNPDWYLSGNYLYTKSLENIQINPGEEKEIKLILSKSMTNDNVGLINNRAEIYQDYNKYGESDIDSIPNNKAQNEDDFGTTDVIIQVATGDSIIFYIILVIINIALIYIAIKIMIKNELIKIRTKEERRKRL